MKTEESGRVVIVAYRPRAGRAEALASAVRRHGPLLRAEGLVTARPFAVMQAEDGTLVEVFEWASPEAIEAAHANPRVQALWADFSAACEYVPIGSVAEASELFSEFSPRDDLALA
jgi:quinol monooxygenase YgiN